jgi:hypothetical protein
MVSPKLCVALCAVALALFLAPAPAAAASASGSCLCSNCSSSVNCNAVATLCSSSDGGSGSCSGGANPTMTCSISGGGLSCGSQEEGQDGCNSLCSLACNPVGTWECSESKCFPAAATVELENGSTKTMAEVQIGDRVLVAAGVYSPVYMFSHRLEAVKTAFVTVEAAGLATPLQLTPDHYLYVNGELATAATVTVGDAITLRDGARAAVTKVHTTWAQGLYNPHTLHGDIVVNGVTTSTYTQGIAPALAHAALWPVRALYAAGLAIADTKTFAAGSQLLADLLPNGPAKY